MSSSRLRWLIIGPVMLFVMGVLMVSCGGGGGGCVGTFDAFGNFIPGFCPTPGPGPGFNLETITLCEGTAPPQTPTPSPTSGVPSATATATLCPQAANTAVPVGPQVGYHANGLFVRKSQMVVLDITHSLSTLWTSSNSAALQPPNSSSSGGIYQPVSPGCACINASSGGIASLPVGILVFSSSAPTPTCSVTCPTPIPTTSATPAAASTAATSASNRSARLDGVLQWTFDPLMALAGPPVASVDGNLYFLTADGQLHALNARGREMWRRSSGGKNVAVGTDRTVYAMGHDGSMEALSPHGKPLWTLRVDSAHGPLATADGTVYVQQANDLIAATAPGLIQWRVSLPGEITSLAISANGTVIAGINGGSVVALDKNGTQLWSFAPAGGFAGEIATRGDTAYLGSASGSVYALDALGGSQLWRYDSAAPVNGGPVVNGGDIVFFASDATYALTSDGRLAWTKFVPPSSAVPLGTDGIGLFAPIHGGFSALLNPDGTIKWTTGSFGSVEHARLAPSGVLYVVTSSGRIFAIR